MIDLINKVEKIKKTIQEQYGINVTVSAKEFIEKYTIDMSNTNDERKLTSEILKFIDIQYFFFQYKKTLYFNPDSIWAISIEEREFNLLWKKLTEENQHKEYTSYFEQQIKKVLEIYDFSVITNLPVEDKDTKQRLGEIDFIAYDDKYFIFGEIKTTRIRSGYSDILFNYEKNIKNGAIIQLDKISEYLNPETLTHFQERNIDIDSLEKVPVVLSNNLDSALIFEDYISGNLFILEDILSRYKNNKTPLWSTYQEYRDKANSVELSKNTIKFDSYLLEFEEI